MFYQIRKDSTYDEISFIETAKTFKTNSDENSVGLHDKHHKQVAVAVKDFNEKLQKESAEQQAVDVSQSPAEKGALAFLDAFLDVLLDMFLDTINIKHVKYMEYITTYIQSYSIIFRFSQI